MRTHDERNKKKLIINSEKYLKNSKNQNLGMIISRAPYISINEGLKEVETKDEREAFLGFLLPQPLMQLR